MQKHVNHIDLVKSFPTNIFLETLASIQQRTSLIKFDHLAEQAEKGSTSNLLTKRRADVAQGDAEALRGGFDLRRELYRARSILYRRQILQENIRWKALDEIYKIYMLLHRSNLIISEMCRQTFVAFFGNFLQKFSRN